MDRLKRFFIHYWPTMIVVGVILYATLDDHPVEIDESLWFPHLDKLIHAIMMGGLLGAIAFDMQRANKRRNMLSWRLMWTICACVIAFGAVDELAQGMMHNGRGTEWLDFVADCVGAVSAVFLAPPAIRKVLRIKK